jgi:hypothetical protein
MAGTIGGRFVWLHPAINSRYVVPRILAATYHTMLRDTFTFNFVTHPTNVGMAAIAPMVTAAAANIYVPGVFGRTWSGGNYTAGNNIATSQGANLSPNKVRINRFGVTVTCVGPTAVGVLIPGSTCHMGALRGPMDFNTNPSAAVTYATFLSRPEAHLRTASQLSRRPEHITSFPVDKISWYSFDESTSTASTTDIPADAMSTILLAFGTSSSLDNYVVTVHVEWSVLFESSTSSLLATTHNLHPTVSEAVVDSAAIAAGAACGLVSRAAGIIEGVAGEAVAAGRLAAARALPALGDLAPIAPLM